MSKRRADVELRIADGTEDCERFDRRHRNRSTLNATQRQGARRSPWDIDRAIDRHGTGEIGGGRQEGGERTKDMDVVERNPAVAAVVGRNGDG